MVMIGTVTFDGISAGPTWLEQTTPMTGWVADLGFGPRFGVEIVYGLGMLAIVALVAGVYRLAAGAYAGRYVLSMVPIALAYCAAHYVSLLLFTGQNAVFLASDPLGRGWDLFGTAGGRMNFFLSAEVFWYLQLFFVIGGHVAAIVLAHDRALVMKAVAPVAVPAAGGDGRLHRARAVASVRGLEGLKQQAPRKRGC